MLYEMLFGKGSIQGGGALKVLVFKRSRHFRQAMVEIDIMLCILFYRAASLENNGSVMRH